VTLVQKAGANEVARETLVNVAYGALNASLTRDADEITTLTAVRIFLANAGCLVAMAGVPLLPALRRLLGKKGLFYVFGAVAVVGMAALYVLSRAGAAALVAAE